MATIPSAKNAHHHGDCHEAGEEITAAVRDIVVTVTVIVEAAVELTE